MAAQEPQDPLDIANRADAAALRVLAEIEWRSRTAAWDLYVASGNDLADAIDAKMAARVLWERTTKRATRIAMRCWPDLWAETLAIDVMRQAVLIDDPLIRDRVKPGTRVILGRAWRRWLQDTPNLLTVASG